MLKLSDRRKVAKRKKLWDIFRWGYKGIGDLHQNGSLNCGCAMCKMKTYYHRLENKQQRLKNKLELKKNNYGTTNLHL